MKLVLFELRLMLHSRLASAALVLFMAMMSLSVYVGLQASHRQQQALARIAAEHRDELAVVAAKYRTGGEAGYAAYSTPHLTMHPPSPLAFAAFGQRDLQPYSLRVRLLGLHSQLYESEQVHPDLVMPGRFDFAFVLVYLAPLFVITLMHDLLSGERERGRLRLLLSLPHAPSALWGRRVGVRLGTLMLAALLPLALGTMRSGALLGDFALAALVSACYLGFWFGLAALVAARANTSAASAATLLALLVTLTMVLPTVANALIARAVPVSQGVELALAQRQAVHEGWDLPKQETFAKFFRTHPEWRGTAPVTTRFHWKWYYAMHQAGDDAVADQVAQYRSSMLARERWTANAGLVLPSVALQLVLHRMAHTDLHGQLAYQRRIEAFHGALRAFYYPFIFNERTFGPAEFRRAPVYRAEAGAVSVPAGLVTALALLAAMACAAGLRGLARPGRSD